LMATAASVDDDEINRLTSMRFLVSRMG